MPDNRQPPYNEVSPPQIFLVGSRETFRADSVGGRKARRGREPGAFKKNTAPTICRGALWGASCQSQ